MCVCAKVNDHPHSAVFTIKNSVAYSITLSSDNNSLSFYRNVRGGLSSDRIMDKVIVY